MKTREMSKYIVALLCGGLMESPDFYHSDGQIIEAETKKEAEETYNSKNNCSFFYGDVVAKESKSCWEIIDNKVTKYWLDSALRDIEYFEKFIKPHQK
jgi:hypothetical protein